MFWEQMSVVELYAFFIGLWVDGITSNWNRYDDYTVAFKAPTWTWYVSGLYSFDGTNEITESKEH